MRKANRIRRLGLPSFQSCSASARVARTYSGQEEYLRDEKHAPQCKCLSFIRSATCTAAPAARIMDETQPLRFEPAIKTPSTLFRISKRNAYTAFVWDPRQTLLHINTFAQVSHIHSSLSRCQFEAMQSAACGLNRRKWCTIRRISKCN